VADNHEPSLFQRVVKAVLGEGVEEESRAWVFNCECGEQWSVWHAGGVRYKAAGKPRKLNRCRSCGKVALRPLRKNTE